MNVQAKANFLDRTLHKLLDGWRSMAGASYDAEHASSRPDLPKEDLAQVRNQMSTCLEGKGGEVSARSRAAGLGHVYLALNDIGKERFLRILNDDFRLPKEFVNGAITEYLNATDPVRRAQAEANLRESLASPRLKLLRQFNGLPDGVKFLVDIRASILRLIRRDSTLRPLEQDLKYLLSSWFDIGFLELRQISWDSASAALLEKLIAYEAVHTISSWDDLKNRLDSDRRCFAYFHPKMPDEPLIFVEVALVNGLAGNVQALLDEGAPVQDPNTADTAIFYSISNAQKGLSGISLGNFLIKRVAAELSEQFKGLKTFATLSPIPGFMNWFGNIILEDQPALLTPTEQKSLSEFMSSRANLDSKLKELLSHHSWVKDETFVTIVKPILLRLVAHYLVDEKRENGEALDQVAHFHLNNGAVMERLNWLGDSSTKGLQQSAGIMINYLYDLDTINNNHEAYADNGKIIASSGIRNLL